MALLRAVNVGGTGRLPMAELVRICYDVGFGDGMAGTQVAVRGSTR